MSYRYAIRADHSDLAAGQVLRSVPGQPGFPVRMADELAQRFEQLDPREGNQVPVEEFLLQRAALSRARSEREVVDAVTAARSAGTSWNRIGEILRSLDDRGKRASVEDGTGDDVCLVDGRLRTGAASQQCTGTGQQTPIPGGTEAPIQTVGDDLTPIGLLENEARQYERVTRRVEGLQPRLNGRDLAQPLHQRRHTFGYGTVHIRG
jgi:hypothetical protein